MGISYDPPSKKWNVVYEKVQITQTDYPGIDTFSIYAYACGVRSSITPGKTLNAQRWNAQKVQTKRC
jgi:hypothetical protein